MTRSLNFYSQSQEMAKLIALLYWNGQSDGWFNIPKDTCASNISITDVINTRCFLGVKGSGLEDGHWLPSKAKVEFGGAIPPFLYIPSFHVNGKPSLYVQSILRSHLRRHRSITNINRTIVFDFKKHWAVKFAGLSPRISELYSMPVHKESV